MLGNFYAQIKTLLYNFNKLKVVKPVGSYRQPIGTIHKYKLICLLFLILNEWFIKKDDKQSLD